LVHWRGQDFGGLDLDMDQEVPEVPEAGICVTQICLDALAGLWKVNGGSINGPREGQAISRAGQESDSRRMQVGCVTQRPPLLQPQHTPYVANCQH
jgi:hypothetical protein